MELYQAIYHGLFHRIYEAIKEDIKQTINDLTRKSLKIHLRGTEVLSKDI